MYTEISVYIYSTYPLEPDFAVIVSQTFIIKLININNFLAIFNKYSTILIV